MTWRLLIDDDALGSRAPGISIENPQWRVRMNLPAIAPATDHLGDWVLALDAQQAIDAITERGMPAFVSFDHDLGDDRDAIAVAHWIIERDLDDGILDVPFEFEVHSGNIVGRRNIRSLLDNYLDFKFGNRETPSIVP